MKQIAINAWAVLVAACSLAVFSSPTKAQVTAQELLRLPTGRIVELARMGEPEAQYWVGRALQTGAIQMPNSSFESIAQWFISAADQGHEEAIFHFFDNELYYPKDRRAVALQLLNTLAVQGSGRAYYNLWLVTRGPKNENHLLEAVRLGYRPAILRVGNILRFSNVGSQKWDLERAA